MIFTTGEVITATLKVISGTTNVILATEEDNRQYITQSAITM